MTDLPTKLMIVLLFISMAVCGFWIDWHGPHIENRLDSGYDGMDASTVIAPDCSNFCPVDAGHPDHSAEHTLLLEHLLRRRVWDGKLKRQLISTIVTVSEQEQVDPILIVAIMKVESNFDRWAVSDKGARGLMQLMPETARRMDVRRPHDVNQGIRGGARYLHQLGEIFPDDVKRVVAAYNAGAANVRTFHGTPPFPETVDYVQRVMHERRALLREKERFEGAGP